MIKKKLRMEFEAIPRRTQVVGLREERERNKRE